MIALDTNVVVRFLVQDDPVQAAQATAVFAELTEDNHLAVPRGSC